MGRAARADRADKADRGGAAARVAQRRRPAASSREGGRKKGGRSAAASGGVVSTIARAFKLVVLTVAFLAIGFFGVLVIDVGASVVGQIRLGETTVAGLWNKVLDRVLDNDVPRAPEVPAAPAPPRKAPPSRAVREGSATAASERAPARAQRPEDDARHVSDRPRTDPQVEQARRRLDELLGRL